MAQLDPSVFIVDDDPAVRDSLTLLLESERIPVRAFGSAEEFLGAYDRARPGCLLADVRLPGLSGIDLLRRLVSEGARIPVIVITGHGDVPLAVAALKAGAFDFIEKPFDAEALLEAVRRALDRERTRHETETALAELAQRRASLTAREREVMDQVVAGQSNKAIANALSISPRTVEIYRANAMTKMGARNLSELVRMALRLDSLPP